MSSSFSFTFRILGLECGFFAFIHARRLSCFVFWMWWNSYRASMMDLNFHGISFFLVPSKRCVGFLVGICSGSLLPPWFNQIVLLNVRQFVPLQYDLPWFLWHQLSCSFSFTLKVLGLECGVFFAFIHVWLLNCFIFWMMKFVPGQYDRPWFSWH